MAKKTVKGFKTKSKKKGKNKKKKDTKKVVKTIDTVIPVSTPVGSVHFDEFLKICEEPKPLTPVVPVEKEKSKKKKKNAKSKGKKKGKKKAKKKGGKKDKKGKNKKSKKKEEKPPLEEPASIYPPLFPLIKTLFVSADDDVFGENTLFSEFVVGKTELPVLKNKISQREVNLMEQQANRTVDEINSVREKIQILTKKPRLTEAENIEMENHGVNLMKLLIDFENYLEKIRDIFYKEQADSVNEIDDGEWTDVDEDDSDLSLEKQCHIKCAIMDQIESQKKICGPKWYEGIDLEFILSPKTSNKDLSMSSGLVRFFDQLTDHTGVQREHVKRNDVFNRLKKKFSILLPPPKLNATKDNLIWVDRKLHKNHQTMLDATKKLKLFQCWNQLELKFNTVNALIISLKDAIKSTSPFYYASKDVKSQFVVDQSALVQELDKFKRNAREAFLQAGLADYWKINPESIRLGCKPCFDITIHQVNTDIERVLPLDDRNISVLQRDPFIAEFDDCIDRTDHITMTDSKDSEVEVNNYEYKDDDE